VALLRQIGDLTKVVEAARFAGTEKGPGKEPGATCQPVNRGRTGGASGAGRRLAGVAAAEHPDFGLLGPQAYL